MLNRKPRSCSLSTSNWSQSFRVGLCLYIPYLCLCLSAYPAMFVASYIHTCVLRTHTLVFGILNTIAQVVVLWGICWSRNNCYQQSSDSQNTQSLVNVSWSWRRWGLHIHVYTVAPTFQFACEFHTLHIKDKCMASTVLQTLYDVTTAILHKLS